MLTFGHISITKYFVHASNYFSVTWKHLSPRHIPHGDNETSYHYRIVNTIAVLASIMLLVIVMSLRLSLKPLS